MKKIMTFLFLMLFLNINVKAASLCSHKEQAELNSKASNIKLIYEVVDDLEYNEDGDITGGTYFNVSILNVTKDFYVIVKNDYNDEEKKYSYEDSKNDIITFTWNYLNKVTNFTAEVFTTSNTGCKDERYKTIYLTTPRYNKYANRSICEGKEDLSLCQEYVTFSELSETDFIEKVIETSKIENGSNNNGEPNKPAEKNFIGNILDFIDAYKVYIIGISIVIIIIILIINRKKTKKQRELGL